MDAYSQVLYYDGRTPHKHLVTHICYEKSILLYFLSLSSISSVADHDTYHPYYRKIKRRLVLLFPFDKKSVLMVFERTIWWTCCTFVVRTNNGGWIFNFPSCRSGPYHNKRRLRMVSLSFPTKAPISSVQIVCICILLLSLFLTITINLTQRSNCTGR